MSYPNPEQTPMGWQPPTGNPTGFPGGQPPGYAGGPPPPPGYPGGPIAPPKRRRRWPWVVLGVIVLLLGALGGCSWLFLRAVGPSFDGGNEWIALLDEQRWDEAYDELCESTRQRDTNEEVVAVLTEHFGAGIEDYQLDQYQNTNGAVTIGGEITIGNDQRPISLRMSDADGEWRVCNYDFVDPDSGS